MLQSLLTLAAACKVLTELFAASLTKSIDDPELRGQAKLLISMVVGVVGAFATGLNLFTAFQFQISVSEIVGVVITGVVVGFGANVINEIFGVLEGWHDAMSGVRATLSQSTTSTPSGTATTTSSTVSGPVATASPVPPINPNVPQDGDK